MSNPKVSVLIVEDEAPMVLVLASIFFKAGFRVFEAREGESGLRIAIAEHPDFILLDLLMPKMDGLAMLAELRKSDWGKRAKIAILTNFNDPERVEAAKTNQVFDFWVKTDWRLDKLVLEVKKRLQIA